MTNSILPLANWGMGTAIIIFFAVLCVVLAGIVLAFVLGGTKKKGNEEVTSTENDNI